MAPLHLTAEELIEATGYRRPADQSRRLTELGIGHHRQAVTGKVVVKRCDYEQPQRPEGAPGDGESYGVNVVAMEALRNRGQEKSRNSGR